MSDPAQQAAARAALSTASSELETAVGELRVLQVIRRRRAQTKIPFYYVTIKRPDGTRVYYQVSDYGQRVERGGIWVRR
jgi:hypothetical protein